MADNVVQVVIRARDEASQEINRTSDALSTLTANAATTGQRLSAATASLGRVAPQAKNAGDAVSRAGGNMASTGDSAKDLANQLGDLGTRLGVIPPGFARLGAVVESSQRLFQGLERTLGGLLGGLSAVDVPLKSIADNLRGFAEVGEFSARTLLDIQEASGNTGAKIQIVADSLTTFVGVLALAEKGTGPAVASLTKLGFTMDQIRAGFGTGEQAMRSILPRLLAVKDTTERASIATGLFGVNAKAVVPALGQLGVAAGGASAGIGALALAIAPVIVALAALVASVLAARAALSSAVEGGRLADEMGTLAERAGVTSEQFSRLAFAADQSDASVGALSTALRFLNRNIFEAQTGSTEAQKGFLALGFTIEEIQGGLGGTNEAFLEIVDRLSRVRDQSTRTGVAMRLLGRGAEELNPLFAQGRSGVEAFGAELDALGGTVSSSAVQIGDAFDKELKRLRAAQQGIQLQLAQSLLPTITELAEQFTRLAVGIGRVTEQMRGLFIAANTATKALADGAGIGQIAIGALRAIPALRTLIDLLRILQGLGGSGVSPERQAQLAAGRASPTAPTVDNARVIDAAKLLAAAEAADKAREAAKKTAEEMAKLRKAFEQAAQSASLVPDAIAEALFRVNPEGAAKAVAALQKQLEDAIRSVGKLDGPDVILNTLVDKAQLEAEIKRLETEIGVDLPIEVNAADLAAARRQLEAFRDAFERRPLRLRIEQTEDLKDPGLDLSGVNDDLAEIAAQLSRAGLSADELNARALTMQKTFAETGIVISESLTDALIEAQTTLGTLTGDIVVMGEAFRVAFEDAFDPLKRGIQETQSAVRVFADEVNNALSDSLRGFIFEGQKGLKTLGDLFVRIGQAAEELVKQLIIAAAKAAILKALGLEGGGEIKSGGIPFIPFIKEGGQIAPRMASIARMASGGQVAVSQAIAPIVRLVAGGGIRETIREKFHSATTVVHAAAGLTVVPGSPQRRDSVPALLAPGEVVLPFVNGQRPADILGTLTRLPEMIANLMRSELAPQQQLAAAGPLFGQVVVQAFDADSIANAARNGELARQLGRAAELGR